MNRHLLYTALKDMLVVATHRPWEINKVPELPNNPERQYPYGIIVPMPVARGTGSFHNIEEEHDFLFLCRNVGKTEEQTSWLSDTTHRAITWPGALNGYETRLAVEGMMVVGRSLDSLGSILPSGKNLLEMADQYRIRVGE